MSLDLPRPNIVDLFEHFGGRVLMTGTGLWKKAHCCIPGHDDSRASAEVNEEEGRWRCWVCPDAASPSRDAIDLIMRINGSDFATAVEWATQFTGDAGPRTPRASDSILSGRPVARAGRRAWRPTWLK